MKDSTSKLRLGVAAGGGAMWAFSRWRRKKKRRPTDEDWGAEHDEDPVPSSVGVDEAASTAGGSVPASGSAPAGESSKDRGLSRRFDRIFMAHGMGLPVPYLRALADRESGMNPDDPKGLINVIGVVLDDFNEAQDTDLDKANLKDPRTNVTIAAWALRKIVDSLAKWHPDVPNLREDWTNRHFVELLTFAWNAGWSRSSGVGRVVDYLKERGQYDITLPDIVKHADAAGASHWLWAHPKKPKWTVGVVTLYIAELERDIEAGRYTAPSPPVMEESDPPVVVHVEPAPPHSPPTPAAPVPAPAPPEPTPPSAPAPPAPSPIDPYPSPIDPYPTLALDFGRPVPDDVEAVVSSGWSSPRPKRRATHHSIDIPLKTGTPVLAVDDGVVILVRKTLGSNAGLYVSIRHPSGVVSRYLHLSETLVEKDQGVRRGDVIGKAGSTGTSVPHLHLDLHAPESLLPQIEAAVGQPAGGFGEHQQGIGVKIPAEPWIPVDGYHDKVVKQAERAGIPLWRSRRLEPDTFPDIPDLVWT
jgi:murein DD-endopeptidase MepM/ murein hydrolase activator NlpD